VQVKVLNKNFVFLLKREILTHFPRRVETTCGSEIKLLSLKKRKHAYVALKCPLSSLSDCCDGEENGLKIYFKKKITEKKQEAMTLLSSGSKLWPLVVSPSLSIR